MKNLLLFSITLFLFSSCEKAFQGKDEANDPISTFNYLWKNVDEKYSFFKVKNIDWDSVKDKYEPQIKNGMSEVALFDICAEMLNELEDGHVNLFTSFKTSRYTPVFYDVPENYEDRVIYDNYLEGGFETTGPFSYGTILSGSKRFGYIYYGSFQGEFSVSQLEFVLSQFINLDGLIIDVRNNGGGFANLILDFVNSITNQKKVLYTTYAKNGLGHEDFADGVDVYSEPTSFNYQKPIAVLTNRLSYSATSFFAAGCKSLDNIILVGDTTGGGGGIPTGAQLPNGWNYRFSATRTQLPNGYEIEKGVIPDFPVWISESDKLAGVDSILEKALLELSK